MIDKRIHKFLNRNVKQVPENEYYPNIKIKKTVRPDKDYTFNEVFEHIHKELKK